MYQKTWLVTFAVIGAALASSPAAAADQRCTIGQLMQLPVTIVDRQPTVPAMINGNKVALVVDSGAFFSVLSSSVAAEYQLPHSPAPEGFYLEVIGGRTEVDIATVKDFSLGGHSFKRVQFLVGTSEPGEAGLLGQNFLGMADVEYDLPDGAVRLMQPRGCGHANLAYWVKNDNFSMLNIESADSAGKHTQGTVEIDGVKLRAIFDTGAATTILTRHAANRLGFRPDGPKVTEAGVTRGLGRGVVQTWIAPFGALTLGDNETIKNIRLRVGEIDDDSFDMLIGADFFLSHRVYVSNQLGKMYFSYIGGPVFDLSVHHDTGSTAGPLPADAPTTRHRRLADPRRACARRGLIVLSGNGDRKEFGSLSQPRFRGDGRLVRA